MRHQYYIRQSCSGTNNVTCASYKCTPGNYKELLSLCTRNIVETHRSHANKHSMNIWTQLYNIHYTLKQTYIINPKQTGSWGGQKNAITIKIPSGATHNIIVYLTIFTGPSLTCILYIHNIKTPSHKQVYDPHQCLSQQAVFTIRLVTNIILKIHTQTWPCTNNAAS